MMYQLTRLPKEIGQLKELRHLLASFAQISEILFEIINNSKLEILSLKKNKINDCSSWT